MIAGFRIRRGIALLTQRARNDAGMAAVEFSLILPILVLLWIGGVEVTQALSIDRRLNNLASAIGDLVARSKTMSLAEIDKIFDIGPAALFPYCETEAECIAKGMGMRVTAVDVDGSKNATVAWSEERGNLACAPVGDMNATVPLQLRVEDTQVIMSEVCYTYTPAVGYVITGDRVLNDRMFFVPRLVTKVTCASC